MVNFYDEIEIEDFEYDPDDGIYYYPCPCGDRFQISKEELESGEEIATCPSCSLILKVIYDKEDFVKDGEKESQIDENLIKSVRKLELN